MYRTNDSLTQRLLSLPDSDSNGYIRDYRPSLKAHYDGAASSYINPLDMNEANGFNKEDQADFFIVPPKRTDDVFSKAEVTSGLTSDTRKKSLETSRKEFDKLLDSAFQLISEATALHRNATQPASPSVPVPPSVQPPVKTFGRAKSVKKPMRSTQDTLDIPRIEVEAVSADEMDDDAIDSDAIKSVITGNKSDDASHQSGQPTRILVVDTSRSRTEEQGSGESDDGREFVPLKTGSNEQPNPMFTKQTLSPTSESSAATLNRRKSLLDNLKTNFTSKHFGPSSSTTTATPATGVSALSTLMDKKAVQSNPFAEAYSRFGAKTDPNAMRLQIFLPFSKEALKPIFIAVHKDASVDEVIGYTLFEYVNANRLPMIPQHLWIIKQWNLRIVEDDGSIDDDFPALERSRKIQKYAFDRFALCEQTPIEPIKQKKQQTQQEQLAEEASVLMKVHLYSTLEVKQTTTMQLPLRVPMVDVFQRICLKRKYDPKDYVLKMADTKTDIPLDKTLEQLNITEFCFLKRSSGGAGDIFLRPPDEETPTTDNNMELTEDFRSIYKQYKVVYKHLMGKHDRILILDGEHIHLVVPEGKALFDMGKTTNSFHVSAIISCETNKSKPGSTGFKISVQRDKDLKVYDLDASSAAEMEQIRSRITQMVLFHRRSVGIAL